MDYSVTAFSPGDGQVHLYLIHSDNQEDGQKLAGMLEQIAPGSYDPQTLITVIETRPATVRGQQAMLVISEGRTSEGDSYRQAALAFQGNGGPALLVFTAPVTSRDQDTWMHFSHLFTNKMSYP